MENTDRQQHWNNIYQTKALHEVSWYQPKPETSLQLIQESNLPLTANIIDVGGGDSYLVDYLLQAGYRNITVLDISEKAILRAKTRLGSQATLVNWIVTDIVDFKPEQQYDCWHDRAAFHFLTTSAAIDAYTKIVQEAVTPNGLLIVATFSEQGPTKCSGITIQQYSAASLTQKFQTSFTQRRCFTVAHQTPFNTTQDFLFCSFQRSAV